MGWKFRKRYEKHKPLVTVLLDRVYSMRGRENWSLYVISKPEKQWTKEANLQEPTECNCVTTSLGEKLV